MYRMYDFDKNDQDAMQFFIEHCKRDGFTEISVSDRVLIMAGKPNPVGKPVEVVIDPVPIETINPAQSGAIDRVAGVRKIGSPVGDFLNAPGGLVYRVYAGGPGTESFAGRCLLICGKDLNVFLVKNDFFRVYSRPGVLEKIGAPVTEEYGEGQGSAKQRFLHGEMIWDAWTGTKVYGDDGVRIL